MEDFVQPIWVRTEKNSIVETADMGTRHSIYIDGVLYVDKQNF